MIHKKRRCPSCGAWFDRQMLLCPLCGQEWRRIRQSDICRACGARIAPGDDPCPYCDASRGRRLRFLPRLGSAVLSLAIIALGAGLIWWMIPLGAEVGDDLAPTPTVLRPTAVDVAQVLATAPSLLTPTAAAGMWPTATPQHLPDVDLEAPTLTPSPTPTATESWTPPTKEAPVNVAEPTAAPATPNPSPTDEPPTPTPQPTAGPRVHVVAQGDMLGALAVRYDVSSAEIAEANGITLTTVLRVGQELVIPGGQAEASSPELDPTETPIPPAATAAPQAPEPTPTPTPAVRRHTVQAGQNLGGIAGIYGVSIAAIAEANGIRVGAILSIGQELIIPAPGGGAALAAPTATLPPAADNPATATPTVEPTPAVQRTSRPTEAPTPTPAVLRHVVARGDTLGGIAVRYGVFSADIARANGITLTTILRIGQELIIPGSTVEPTPSAPDATPTPEATATPTLTITPSPTMITVRTPAAVLPYRAPVLLTPISGVVVRGDQSQPVLQWASVGILAEDEAYQVSLWTPESRGAPIETLTRATYYRVSRDLYPEGRRDSRFEWQVTVVRVVDAAPGRLALSASSETYSFIWR